MSNALRSIFAPDERLVYIQMSPEFQKLTDLVLVRPMRLRNLENILSDLISENKIINTVTTPMIAKEASHRVLSNIGDWLGQFSHADIDSIQAGVAALHGRALHYYIPYAFEFMIASSQNTNTYTIITLTTSDNLIRTSSTTFQSMVDESELMERLC